MYPMALSSESGRYTPSCCARPRVLTFITSAAVGAVVWGSPVCQLNTATFQCLQMINRYI